MSFYGNLEDNKKFAHHADHQIDGLEPSATSPVQSGGDGAGGAPLEKGETEFVHTRTRPNWKGQSANMRRRSNQM